MSTKSVIITAGGIGKRMGSTLPKQFLEINKKAILLHCIEAFYNFDNNIQIIVTLPKDWKSFWNKYLKEKNINIDHTLVDGGLERFHSIKNALKIATGELIAIHDGVRPIINLDLIQSCFLSADKFGSGIPVIKLKESLRQIKNNKSYSVNRAEFVHVQTPQCFQKPIISKAYESDFEDHFTDDASLVESKVCDVHLVSGIEENIKITSQMDLKLAKILINNK